MKARLTVDSQEGIPVWQKVLRPAQQWEDKVRLALKVTFDRVAHSLYGNVTSIFKYSCNVLLI